MILALELGTQIASQADPAKDLCSLSWRLWSSSPAETTSVHGSVDQIFEGYSFYPELEWKNFGCFPPDGHKVLGAWRHPDIYAFVFLLDNPGMASPTGMQQLVLTYSGEKAQLTPLRRKIEKLSRELVLRNRQRINILQIQARLEKNDKSGALKRLLALMGPITLAINGFAAFLHKLAPPSIQVEWLSKTYQLLLVTLYASSLVLLILFCWISFAYLAKYGFMLLRRM